MLSGTITVAAPTRRGRIEVLEEPKEPTLYVESQPSGAAIAVDGRAYGVSPQKLTLSAGQYRIRAEKDGYQVWDKRIRFDGVGDAHLQIELEEKPRVVEAFFPMTVEQAAEVQRSAAEALGVPLHDELDCSDGVKLELVLVPAGEFLMGSPDDEAERYSEEGPQHQVRLTRPFYLGMYPVTQLQYMVVTMKKRSEDEPFRRFGFEDESNPVEPESYEEATAYCRKLTELTGRIVRLPTEAEWEYACRAGNAARFSYGDFSDDLSLYAWYVGNAGGRTHPVGQKKPNSWGLYDMHGNVWELCVDWLADTYTAAKSVDPRGPRSGRSRVLRGGSRRDNPRNCRSASRGWITSTIHDNGIGFRVVVDL